MATTPISSFEWGSLVSPENENTLFVRAQLMTYLAKSAGIVDVNAVFTTQQAVISGLKGALQAMGISVDFGIGYSKEDGKVTVVYRGDEGVFDITDDVGFVRLPNGVLIKPQVNAGRIKGQSSLYVRKDLKGLPNNNLLPSGIEDNYLQLYNPQPNSSQQTAYLSTTSNTLIIDLENLFGLQAVIGYVLFPANCKLNGGDFKFVNSQGAAALETNIDPRSQGLVWWHGKWHICFECRGSLIIRRTAPGFLVQGSAVVEDVTVGVAGTSARMRTVKASTLKAPWLGAGSSLTENSYITISIYAANKLSVTFSDDNPSVEYMTFIPSPV